MANQRTPVLSGISEFGEINSETAAYAGDGTDESWGATERNGVTLAMSGEDVDVMSGQNLMLQDSFPSSRAIELTARLQHAGLINIADALGIPDSDLAGDLNAATPTDEVLSIDGTNIGQEEKTLYILTPGPVSTRRYQVHRAKQRAGLNMEFAINDYVKIETTWSVLDAGAGNDEMQITDAAS